MGIKRVAECDGPTCGVMAELPATLPERGWPDGFIVIHLTQARGGLMRRAGQDAMYMFCTRSCLVEWVTG